MCFALSHWAHAKTITDMVGRRVEIPDVINKVYTPSPTGETLLYTLKPQLLCGLLFPQRQIEREMLAPYMRTLPVIGSLTGEGGVIANKEAVLNANPDLILLVIRDDTGIYLDPLASRAEETLAQIAPCVYIYARDLRDYPAAYAFLGDILGLGERANQLTAYIENTLAEAETVVAKVKPEQRPKVYYAEQLDGLSTENAQSYHAALLKLAGDVNVHRKLSFKSSVLGYEKLSLEQVMAYNPDFILAYHKVFFGSVYNNPGWRQVKAVKNKNVLWIPRGPYNWFDRPPSFMGALGLKWLLANLYPQHYDIDLVTEAVEFYRLFLWSEVSETQMQKIIWPNIYGYLYNE